MLLKYDYIHKFINMKYKIKTNVWYRLFFAHIGKETNIIKPLRINNPQYIHLGDRVIINKYTWILTLKVNNDDPKLIVDDGAIIGHYNHITCVNNVYIGKNVLIADRVYISDNYHGYEDINIPINCQKVKSKSPVYIGESTWIGDNVSIISAKIGKHCVIGANSVVNKDIPDYCIAVGSPARIVKRYNKLSGKWQKTNNEGKFI